MYPVYTCVDLTRIMKEGSNELDNDLWRSSQEKIKDPTAWSLAWLLLRVHSLYLFTSRGNTYQASYVSLFISEKVSFPTKMAERGERTSSVVRGCPPYWSKPIEFIVVSLPNYQYSFEKETLGDREITSVKWTKQAGRQEWLNARENILLNGYLSVCRHVCQGCLCVRRLSTCLLS